MVQNTRTKGLDQEILEYLKVNPGSSSTEIEKGLESKMSLATIKRNLVKLQELGFITTEGRLKSTRYSLSASYAFLMPIDVERYFQKEIDERDVKSGFNFELLRGALNTAQIFNREELVKLDELQENYTRNISTLSDTILKKELERLAIDLSWKSSQIEGNTYSLLETERLLKEQITAEGKGKDEATMLLNHKEALDFIIEHPDYLNPLTVRGIEDIHSILIKDLGVERNIRSRRVGITGTNYEPLDNEHQIREALQDLCDLIDSTDHVFTKALLVLLLISYIQPFEDGNKRTARIVCNAVLMVHKHCPLSFRTVDAVYYKKAMLLFYEQNNLSAFKQLFIEQCEFAVKTYFK